jgi:hypothetical protein
MTAYANYVIAAIGIVAFWLVGGGPRSRAISFCLSFVNQLIWVIYAVATGQYGFVAGAVVFGAVAVRNLYRLAPRRAREG